MVISLSYPSYTVRRICFAKRFFKRLQLLHRIHSTGTAIAEATIVTAGALSNAPLRFCSTAGRRIKSRSTGIRKKVCPYKIHIIFLNLDEFMAQDRKKEPQGRNPQLVLAPLWTRVTIFCPKTRILNWCMHTSHIKLVLFCLRDLNVL
jgi:hypothetical protein